MALGFYNKYNLVFLIVGLAAGLILTSQRAVFTRSGLYLAALLCILLLLPNILWQINHQFPVLLHMRVLHQRQLVHVDRLGFLLDQIKFGLLGFLAIPALWGLVFYKPFRPYRFVLFTYLTVMILFVISRGKNYYAIGLYPVLFALGAVYLERISKGQIIWIFPALGVVNIVAILAIVPFLMPLKSPEQIVANPGIFEKVGMLRWEDGKNHDLPQDFADMLGWREMAAKAAQAFEMIPEAEQQQTLVFCDNYGQTGAVNHYNRGRMPEAHSFTADYIFWLPKLDTIRNIVFVGELPDKEVVDMFEEYRWIGKVENTFAREHGTNIYLLLGGSDAVTRFFYQEAEERKKNWDIF
ncbi:MAG: hypothetical protein HC819_00170 [Cyclobacteriaceae bacterium]|nr:hypothetical protein [Cyclobacteriaceae bacterium]